MTLSGGEIKGRIRRRGAKRRVINDYRPDHLWVCTKTVTLDTFLIRELCCQPSKQVHLALVLACWVWKNQKHLPDITGWTWAQIRQTFGRSPDPRVIKQNYEEVREYVEKLVYYRRAQFGEGSHDWVFRKSNGKCHHCGTALDPQTFHIDHLVPIARGGLSHNDNLVGSCPPCNLSKAARS